MQSLVAAALSIAFTAPPNAPRLEAARTAEPPILDGRLDDGVWGRATPGGGFTQKFPEEGAAASERTFVRVLYDDEALYVAVLCEQKLSPLSMRLSRRDREIEADQVSVIISSRRDQRTAFQFGLTASGVQSDGMYFDDDRYSRTWDENWDGEVARTPAGWSAELRIPLRALRFDELPAQDWGFNVRRFISAKQETSEWSFSPRSEAGVVSRFGRLDNLIGLKPRHGIELRPFALAEVRQVDVGFAPHAGTSQRFSGGLDAKVHATPNLAVDATVNPDFGQVETDEVVLNLTNVETHFPEKRPFFQEGTDVFQTQRTIVYTRRVGSVPAAPALPSGEALQERIEPTPIYGALKLTGRPVPRLALGALSALTGPHTARAATGDGAGVTRVAAPLTVWNALRLRGDFDNGGHIGLLATGVSRAEDPSRYPLAGGGPDSDPGQALCPGGQQISRGQRCFRDSYVAGVDGRWRSPSRNYAVGAQALGSVIDGGPARPQRDGTIIGSGDGAPILAFNAEKEGGDWLWNLWSQYTGRTADFNDLGYMQRQNELRIMAHTSYRTTGARGPTLGTLTGVTAFHQENLDRLPINRWLRVGTNWQLRNFWGTAVRLVYYPTAFDDREVGNGAALERKSRLGGEVEIWSDPRRRVMGSVEAGWQHMPGGVSYEAAGTLRLRALPQLDIDVAPNVAVRTGEPRYVERETSGTETRYVVGNLAARSLGATLRLTWTFSPRLTLQGYAQVFAVSKRYSDFASVDSVAQRPVIHFADLQPAAAPEKSADGNEAVFNANVILRWEYRLGSTLYFVYSRAQRPADDVVMSDFRDLSRLGALTSGPAANVVMLKLAYWWG